jgi:hypothetical protein
MWAGLRKLVRIRSRALCPTQAGDKAVAWTRSSIVSNQGSVSGVGLPPTRCESPQNWVPVVFLHRHGPTRVLCPAIGHRAQLLRAPVQNTVQQRYAFRSLGSRRATLSPAQSEAPQCEM